MKNILVTSEFINSFNTIWLGHSKCNVSWVIMGVNSNNDFTFDNFSRLICDILNSFHWIAFHSNEMKDFIKDISLEQDKIYSYNNWKPEYFNLEFFKIYEPGYEIYLPALIECFDVDRQESSYIEWGCNINLQQIFIDKYWYPYISFELRPNFFYSNFSNINTTLSPEFVAHNRELLSQSFEFINTLGYKVDYLPIDNFGRAYSRGARWDETGFLDYGKYSKCSDNNLRELYQMMVKNGEDVSEIKLELQVRKIYLL